MRWLAILVALLGPAAAVGGEEPDVVDVSSYAVRLRVLHDGKGHYLAVTVPDAKTGDWPTVAAFYGDGKVFHDVGWTSGGQPPKTYWLQLFGRRTTSSRVIHEAGAWTLDCDERKTALTALGESESKDLVQAATLRGELWNWKPLALLRDDEARYYYVDQKRRPKGNKVYRVFVGVTGAMKQLKIKNQAIDSAGDLFATKDGSLKLTRDGAKGIWNGVWIQKKERTELTAVGVGDDSRSLIYNDLGVYEGEKMGSPCDDDL